MGTPAPALRHWYFGGHREAVFRFAASLISAGVAGRAFAACAAAATASAPSRREGTPASVTAATPASVPRAGGGVFAGLMSSGTQGRAQNPLGNSLPRASDCLR